ncbi:MAG: 4Fe-4S binding protein [Candidatus Nezhaarchaeota archaeon]|nr:4Fe-4S binding protein [Candidatus Nezhaarchaeota archaeon]MCX8141689.1 4Fe-4S binding protein [Candidatus Nezhaarchaeota archaeon]MDW8049956.1 4Fe-4S binding protein [Nitrososphaerota archaeon]
MVEILIDREKCTNCGTCVSVCPTGVYEMKENKLEIVNKDACLACRACEAQCPNQAIQIIE